MLTIEPNRYTLLPRLKSMLSLNKIRIHGELSTRPGFGTDQECWLVREMKLEHTPDDLWLGDLEDYFCSGRDLPLTDANQL